MQDLNAVPNMASPYTPAGGNNMPSPSGLGTPTAAQPVLGTPVPGTTGGLPAKPGLSVFNNPLPQSLQSQPNQPQQAAQQTQSYGRGQDTMLVHMTPDEVNSLRGLAQQFGGDLTQNPHTGLPEAGWLGKLLPTILGGIGMAFGIPPVWMGALGAVGGTAITGDLKQGLLAGLGAFGGASLAGAAGVGGALGHVGSGLGLSGSGAAVMHPAVAAGAGSAVPAAVPAGTIPTITGTAAPTAAAAAAPAATTAAATTAAAKTGLAGLAQNFGAAAKAGLPGGIIGKAAPLLAAQGVLGSVSNAMTPGVKDQQTGIIDNSYEGPYYMTERKATFAPSTQDLLSSTKERNYFPDMMPEVRNAAGQLIRPGTNTAPGSMIRQAVLNPNAKKGQNMYSFVDKPWMGAQQEDQQQDPLAQQFNLGYAHGGKVHMDEGSFVMPARETAEFGKGSTAAGQRALGGLGGIPIRGPGDGTSDSIPASIGGSQEARVADGEVYFPAHAVKRIGKGDHKRGTKKLYSMMKKAEQSRKQASRGGNGANLMRGLA